MDVKEYIVPVVEALKVCCGFAPRQDIIECLIEGGAVGENIDEEVLSRTLKVLTTLGFVSLADDKYTLESDMEVADINPGRLLEEAGVRMVEAKEFYSEEEAAELKKVLLDKLKKMNPYDFERLVAKLLVALGFVSVKQQGGSGDGGRDVTAKYLINGVITHDVIVQCKRYENKVSSPDMQKFNGTLSGRNAMGLFVTTSDFSAEAKKEAERPGTASIQLIDGPKLVQLMIDTGVGIRKKTQTVYSIDYDVLIENK